MIQGIIRTRTYLYLNLHLIRYVGRRVCQGEDHDKRARRYNDKHGKQPAHKNRHKDEHQHNESDSTLYSLDGWSTAVIEAGFCE